MVLLFSTGVHELLKEQLSDSSDKGESPHHSNGSKAPTPTHFMTCGTLVDVVLCGMLVGFVLGGMLVVYVVYLHGRP